jgi:hypothetical protein
MTTPPPGLPRHEIRFVPAGYRLTVPGQFVTLVCLRCLAPIEEIDAERHDAWHAMPPGMRP